MDKPTVDLAKCDGCGLCARVCGRNGIAVFDHSVRFVDEVDCDWCTECEMVCPTGAIRCSFEIVFEP